MSGVSPFARWLFLIFCFRLGTAVLLAAEPQLPQFDSLFAQAQTALPANFTLSVTDIRPADQNDIWSDLSVRWSGEVPSSPHTDDEPIPFLLYRLSLKTDTLRLTDRLGRVWRTNGGERTLIPAPAERSGQITLRLLPDEEPSLPEFPVSVELDATALIGWYSSPITFPGILAQRLPEASDTPWRLQLDQLTLSVARPERFDDEVRIPVTVAYTAPFDFFDSHEQRLARAAIFLVHPGCTSLAPSSVRPRRLSEDAQSLDFYFPLDRLSSSDPQWSLTLLLPIRVIETTLHLH